MPRPHEPTIRTHIPPPDTASDPLNPTIHTGRVEVEGVAARDGGRHIILRVPHDLGALGTAWATVFIGGQDPRELLKALEDVVLALEDAPTEEHCPACGRRIYAAVARRGICFACAPNPDKP